MQFPPPQAEQDGELERSRRDAPPPSDVDDTDARPGDLTGPWRVALGLAWVAAFFCYAGVWQASVQIGIGTWWVGPRAQPTHVAVKLLPFFLTLGVALSVVYNVKGLVRWSAAGVVGAALISLPDFSRSVGLGVAEAVIAGLLGVITLASLSGRYRIARPTDPAPPVAPPQEATPH